VSAKAKLSRAETNLENANIRSPISGTVIERSVDAGQTIASSFQAPELFAIARDLKKMQIDADVDENDIGQIQQGQRARFTVLAYPDRVFTGTVRQVRLQPETIQNVVNYTVVVDVSNEEGLLLPGMTATVDFVVLDHPGALLVPNGALSFQPPSPDNPEPNAPATRQGAPGAAEPGGKPEGTRVPEGTPRGMARLFLVAEDGRPRPVIFEPGRSDGVRTEITGDTEIGEGTWVITGISDPGKAKKSNVGRNSLLPSPGEGRGRGPSL
jgi:HlyD family secretion protein